MLEKHIRSQTPGSIPGPRIKRVALAAVLTMAVIAVAGVSVALARAHPPAGSAPVPGDGAPADDVLTFTLHLPLAMRGYAAPVQASVVGEAGYMLSEGQTLAEARTGDDVAVFPWGEWGDDFTCAGNHGHCLAGHHPYRLYREFLTFDLGQVPAGEVVTATMVLYTSMCQREFELNVHRGGWNGRWPAYDGSDWDSYASVLGTYDTAACQEDTIVEIPLPGLVGETVPQRLNMMLVGDEVSEMYPGIRLTVCFLLGELEGAEYPETNLRLVVQGGTDGS